MELVAPQGPVYQAGTLSGNPVVMSAGAAALRALKEEGAYERLEGNARKLCEGIKEIASRRSTPVRVNRMGSMFTIFFTDSEPHDWSTAQRADVQMYARFFQSMLRRGLYFPPSQFECAFLSLAHTPEVIEESLEIIDEGWRDIGG